MAQGQVASNPVGRFRPEADGQSVYSVYETRGDSDWHAINNLGAETALNDMKQIGFIDAPYGIEPTSYAVIGSFLTFAVGWRGEVARKVKKELRAMCAQRR